MMVGGPGVRLMVSLLASMILDVACWGERNEVSRDAWKTPVSCKSTGPLAKLRSRPLQLPNEPIAPPKVEVIFEDNFAVDPYVA